MKSISILPTYIGEGKWNFDFRYKIKHRSNVLRVLSFTNAK